MDSLRTKLFCTLCFLAAVLPVAASGKTESRKYERIDYSPDLIFGNDSEVTSTRSKLECAARCERHWCSHFTVELQEGGTARCSSFYGHSSKVDALLVAADYTKKKHYKLVRPYFVGNVMWMPQACGTFLNVFPGLSFEQSGRLVAWRFHCVVIASFAATIWRPVTGNGSYQLVGKNYITPKALGLQLFEVPATEQNAVRRGDIFGIQYPGQFHQDGESALSCLKGQSGPPYCCGFQREEDLPQYWNLNIPDEDAPIGTVLNVTLNNMKYKSYSLMAFVEP